MHAPLSLPPAVVVHGLPHARAALAPGRPVLLLSAPGAAIYAGAAWWRAMIGAAVGDTPMPDALDCADQPGRALEALACGCGMIILAPCPAFEAVMERACGAAMLAIRPPALDLAERGAERRLARWLEGDSSARFG